MANTLSTLVQSAMAHARGRFQQRVLLGEEAVDGSTAPRSESFRAHYSKSAADLIKRLEAAGFKVSIDGEQRLQILQAPSNSATMIAPWLKQWLADVTFEILAQAPHALIAVHRDARGGLRVDANIDDGMGSAVAPQRVPEGDHAAHTAARLVAAARAMGGRIRTEQARPSNGAVVREAQLPARSA